MFKHIFKLQKDFNEVFNITGHIVVTNLALEINFKALSVTWIAYKNHFKNVVIIVNFCYQICTLYISY